MYKGKDGKLLLEFHALSNYQTKYSVHADFS